MKSVRVSLGYTFPPVQFESFKVAIEVEDEVNIEKGETVQAAFDRVYNFVERKLTEKVAEARSDLKA